MAAEMGAQYMLDFGKKIYLDPKSQQAVYAAQNCSYDMFSITILRQADSIW